jgi:hypothetical protein
MNLFRSEEHARNWAAFNPDNENSLKPVSFWIDLFAGLTFRSRGRSDYLSWLKTEEAQKARAEMRAKLP